MKLNWLNIAIVGSGGFLGASLRYILSLYTQSRFPESSFPYGTLVVNLLGCLIIGLLAGLFELKSWGHTEVRLFLFVGILGGFTTFSTFSHETFLLWENGKMLLSLLNMGVQIFAGLLLVWLGYVLIRYLPFLH